MSINVETLLVIHKLGDNHRTYVSLTNLYFFIYICGFFWMRLVYPESKKDIS